MLAEQRSRNSIGAKREQPWWRGASVYQIYPRSFADTNGDGIGDLPGVTQHLDYVARLGVDAIWLSPFFTSPMRDFGYDVADYCGVDPIFGTLEDFDRLIERAHGLGLRVIIDQVYSHSSDQHPWFEESRSSRDGGKADWYVWADAKPDGSPPNNWQSVFGGPAWTWDARRSQYYLHNFLPQQPDLNLHNKAVQDAMLDVGRFWLDRGVDGFRLDAINFAMHDTQLRDNPPRPPGGKRTRPIDFQQRVYNQSHPAITGFVERIRELTNRYDDRFTLAEVGGDRALVEMHEFTRGDARFNSAYGFHFLYAKELTPQVVACAVEPWPDEPAVGWPSWAFENHDAPRAMSRWIAGQFADRFARTKMLLFATLRGSIIIYQGEELGLTQVEIPFEKLQDPEAIANWPQTLARDGARTPMPWHGAAPNLGFCEGTPWLPCGGDHAALAIDLQEKDGESMLAWARHCLRLRSSAPALRWGSMKIMEAGEQLLQFEREHDGQRLVCTFNLSDRDALFARTGDRVLAATGTAGADRLSPYSAIVEEIGA